MNLVNIFQWIISIFVPALLIELIRRELNQKGPKLVYFVSNIVSHRVVPRPTQNQQQSSNTPIAQPFWLNSLTITLRNNGNVTAKGIEICHPQQPENIQLTPSIEHEILHPNTERNNTIIKIPSIAPGETIDIAYLFWTIADWRNILEYIRSEDGLAKRINVNVLRVFPMWFNYMVLGFCFLGLVCLGLIIWWLYPPVIHCIRWLLQYPRL